MTPVKPNGVLEENAFFAVLVPLLGELGAEGMQAFAKAGAKLWASFGYTTAQEGRSSSQIVEALNVVAGKGEIPIDVVAYPDVLVDRGLHQSQCVDGVSKRDPGWWSETDD